jgi:hypothetical protein
MLKRGNHLFLQSVRLLIVCLAPVALQAGDGVWTASGPEGGYVYDVAADPSTAGTVYAGTSNGLFKSADAGASWSRVWGTPPNELPDDHALCVAISPSGRVYVALWTEGLYWSDDGGVTWHPGNTGIEDANLYGAIIAIDPVPPHDTVFLRANLPYTGEPPDHVFRSDDAGLSWVPAHGTAPDDLPRTTVQGLTFDGDTLYAALWNDGVWKTADGGTTWQAVSAGLPDNYLLELSNSSGGEMYVAFRYEGVFRTTDGGTTWAPANGVPPNELPSGASYTNWNWIEALAVDEDVKPYVGGTLGLFKSEVEVEWSRLTFPVDPVTIQAIEIDPAQEDRVYAATNAGVFRSEDAGASWTELNNGLTAYFVDRIFSDTGAPDAIYILGNDGLAKSPDGGTSWEDLSQGLPTRESYDLAMCPSVPEGRPARLYTGSYSSEWYDDVVFRRDEGDPAWESPLVDPDVFGWYQELWTLDVDPTDPDRVFGGVPGYPAYVSWGETPGGFFRSDDGGANWTHVYEIESAQHPDPAGIGEYYPLSVGVDPRDPQWVYGGSLLVTVAGEWLGHVVRTTDGGASWQEVLFRDYWYWPEFAFDPNDPSTVGTASTVYVFDYGDRSFFRSRDGGATWDEIGNLPGFIREITVDPEIGGTLYAGFGVRDGVWVSRDRGETWRPLPMDGHDNYVRSVKVAVTAPPTIHTGTWGGLYSYTTLGPQTHYPDDGTGIDAQPMAVSYHNVIAAGETTLATSVDEPPVPHGLKLGEPATYYDLSSSVLYVGPIEICIDYNPDDYVIPEYELVLYHGEDGEWIDITTSLDTESDRICGVLTDLPLPCMEPPDGLVSWWPGDGHARDIQGGNDGTLLGGATYAPGVVDQAFSFDGIDDSVEVPYDPSLNIRDEITLDAWIMKTGPCTNNCFIVHKQDGDYPGTDFRYGLLLYGATSQLVLGLNTTGIWEDVVVSSRVLEDNVWYHVAGTYDGSTASIYIDGILEASVARTGQIQPSVVGPLYIGQNVGGFGTVEFFNGLIDEVDVYDRALSAAEVSTLHAVGAAGKCREPSPEVPVSEVAEIAPGLATNAKTGFSTAGLGDLNDDDLADFISGAPSFTQENGGLAPGPEEAGAAVVYLGSTDEEERASPDIIFLGEAEHDRAGVSVAGGFDFNGDGTNDLMIGAEQVDRTDPDNPVLVGAGKAYLIYFDPTDTTHYPNINDPTTPDYVSLSLVGNGIPGVVFTGEALGDQAGFALAGGGLVNAGTGHDIAIGAPGHDPAGKTDAGAVYVVFDDPALSGTVSLADVADAVDGLVYQGDAAGDALGFSVAFPGDVVEPAGEDIIMGAPLADVDTGADVIHTDAGTAYLGSAGTLQKGIIEVGEIGTEQDGAQVRGDQPGEQLGYSVAGGGDNLVNGEPDTLIGAPYYDTDTGIGDATLEDAGRVAQLGGRLEKGIIEVGEIGSESDYGVAGAIYLGNGEDDRLGYSVAGLGDVTGDGTDDIGLGAPFADPNDLEDAGTIYIVEGYDDGTTEPDRGIIEVGEIGTTVAGRQVNGDEAGELAGFSMAETGDIDGDGSDDFVAGSPGADADGEEDTGSVALVLETEDLAVTPPNVAPVADASATVTSWECEGALQATVLLDGSASWDPDGNLASWDWWENGTPLGSGVQVSHTFPLGSHPVTLEVRDTLGLSDTDGITVTVQDTGLPQGGITAPPAGTCFGPAGLPVMVTDSYTDVCDPALTRTYDPGPGPSYTAHGDYSVTLTVDDDGGNQVTDSVGFTIDTVPPVVEWLGLPDRISVRPFNLTFSASDDDGAAGEVVHEVMKLSGCVIYDGATFGPDPDGLLSDDVLVFEPSELCRIRSECGFDILVNPELRVEATDCGDNVGHDARTMSGRLDLSRLPCDEAEQESREQTTRGPKSRRL